MQREPCGAEFLRLSNTIESNEKTRKALSRKDTLDDATVLKCIYFVAYGKGKTPKDVRIIEPSVITLLLNPKKTLEETQLKEYSALFLPDIPLILIPICYNNHWSLLYYRTAAKRWVSMDSLEPLHTRLSSTLPLILYENGLISTPPSDKIYRYKNLTRQPGGWECGSYVILFVQMVLTRDTEEEIQSVITILSEQTRIKLMKILCDYLEGDVLDLIQTNKRKRE